jgi:hypothetical protein
MSLAASIAQFRTDSMKNILLYNLLSLFNDQSVHYFQQPFPISYR